MCKKSKEFNTNDDELRSRAAMNRVLDLVPLQTLTVRRKRFRKAQAKQLRGEGWKEIRPNVYERAQRLSENSEVSSRRDLGRLGHDIDCFDCN